MRRSILVICTSTPRLYRLRGPAPAAIKRRLDRSQPDPLVVALGERQQGTDQFVAVQLEGGFDLARCLVPRARLAPSGLSSECHLNFSIFDAGDGARRRHRDHLEHAWSTRSIPRLRPSIRSIRVAKLLSAPILTAWVGLP